MQTPMPTGDLLAQFTAAATAIQSAERIVLACHVNPDGDALGSMLGLLVAWPELFGHQFHLS